LENFATEPTSLRYLEFRKGAFDFQTSQQNQLWYNIICRKVETVATNRNGGGAYESTHEICWKE